MMYPRNLMISLFGAAVATTTLAAQDLTTYRGFQLGTRLPVVAKQAGLKTAAVRTLHQRPALIQDLEWQAPYLDAKRTADSVRNILFSFYDGALFRLVVTYDRERTEGLTAEDIIDAISAKYGPATKPNTELTMSTTYLPLDSAKIITEQQEKIIARWENDQYSYNLIHPYPSSPYNLIISSKRLEALAQSATIEAMRLDQQDAPQRERAKVDAANAKQVEARRTNKPPFRP